MTSKFFRVGATSAAIAIGAMCLAGPSYAGNVDPNVDDDGIDAVAKATIRINGDVKGGGGSVSASSPALCWWEKSSLTTGGAAGIETILQFFMGLGSGFNFDFGAVKDMLEDQKDADKPLEWYARKARDGATDKQLDAAGCNDPSGPYQGIFVGLMVRPFEPGNPPEPLPDPREMADVAMDHLDIEKPALNWNPKANALGGGTLVNLPTWFWVTNPEPAIGDQNAERSVTATAGDGGNQVTVTVTAKAGNLQITSAGGSATCSNDAARVSYARGVDDSSACTLPFRRSSPDGGFAVVSRVAWSASWTGSGPGVPAGVQEMQGITQESTSYVPVRESQATVKTIR